MISTIKYQYQTKKNILLVLMLHAAPEAALAKALKAIGKLAAVKKPTMIRVEHFD